MSWFLLNRNLTLLEPYDWKLSCTVLRGERGSNAPDLPGKALYPVITLIIMETFLTKMRRLKGIRKVLLLEEAWKAIAKAGMAGFIKYLCAPVQAA